MVQERPAISQMEIHGSQGIRKDQLVDGLKLVGLAEGRIFDKSLLEKAEQELKRQYLGRGKYAVAITTTVTPLERNRIAISFNIAEGEVAKIRQINIVGNQAFTEKELLDLLVLSRPDWMTWCSKNDQYSKQKLSADLETMRSFYLNRGYLEFNLDSTQVSISAGQASLFTSPSISPKAQKYTVSDIKLAGEMLVPEEEMRKLIKIQPGDVFSREKLTETTK